MKLYDARHCSEFILLLIILKAYLNLYIFLTFLISLNYQSTIVIFNTVSFLHDEIEDFIFNFNFKNKKEFP